MGFIDKLKGIFGLKKQEQMPVEQMPVEEQEQNECELPFVTPESITRATEQASERLAAASEVAAVRMAEVAESAGKAMEQFGEAMKQVAENVANELKSIDWEIVERKMKSMNMDKWEIEKAKMANNERRRKKMPMVRRQAHLRNLRNERKRKK